VSFIKRLSGCIKEIAMSFMHLFIKKNHLPHFAYCYEYEYIFEIADHDFDENPEIPDLLYSYSKGYIHYLLCDLYNLEPLNVVELLQKYEPAGAQEERLLECFKKGLRFISGEDCIMNYDYDPNLEHYPEEYEDIEPVTLDRIIRYVYDIDDYISKELEDMTNRHMQESYSVTPTSYLVLRPDTKLFNPSDYPEKFSEWFFEMVEVVNELNKKQTTGYE
jgi:hypothetical protein